MPDTSAISREIQEYILREFLPGENPANLTDSTPLISGGILDSIGMLKLVKHLEDNYQIEVQAHEVDVENFDTIALIANFVLAKKPGD
jgi:acyl carrier protein